MFGEDVKHFKVLSATKTQVVGGSSNNFRAEVRGQQTHLWIIGPLQTKILHLRNLELIM